MLFKTQICTKPTWQEPNQPLYPSQKNWGAFISGKIQGEEFGDEAKSNRDILCSRVAAKPSHWVHHHT